MISKKEETRKRILAVTAALLNATENPDEVTVRKISEMAGVSVGLINYHFISRENLLHEIVSQEMQSVAGTFEMVNNYEDNPLKFLKEKLIHMSDMAMQNRMFNKISLEHDMIKGDFEICLYLVPILKEIFGECKSETQLRLVAFQIIVATQSIFLRQEAFQKLTGINVEIKEERDDLINSIVDDIIK
ncbi:MAG: TetR/AcrR family transcriptional regulator [Acetobacterium sp.]